MLEPQDRRLSNPASVAEDEEVASQSSRTAKPKAPRGNPLIPGANRQKRNGPPGKAPPLAEAAQFVALIQKLPIDWEVAEGMITNTPAVVNSREAVFGWRPLHFAINSRRARLLNLLIGKKVDLNGTCNLNNTALHIAARCNNDDGARLLLAASADQNALNSSGYTPLMCAAMAGSVGVAEVLLETSALIDVLDPDGRTAPMWAARHGHKDVLRCLLQRGVDLSIQDYDGLSVRDHAKHCQQMRSLVTKSEKLMRTLLRAAESNDLPAVTRALTAGAPVDALDAGGNTSLTFAAMNNSIDMVRLLMRHGADPVLSRGGSLAGTAESWRPGSRLGDVIQEMQSSNAGLLISAQEGNVAGVEEALQSGAWPDYQDRKQRRSALAWAVLIGSRDAVTLLAEARADLNAKDAFGKAPVHLAVLGSWGHILSSLHHLGADFESRTLDGDMLLHLAAMADDPAMVQLLQAAEAPLEATNAEERTPVQIAAVQGCASALGALLRIGAAVNTRTDEGHSVLALAAVHGHGSIIKMLLSPVQRPPVPSKKPEKIQAVDEESVPPLDDEGDGDDEDDMSSIASMQPPSPSTGAMQMSLPVPSGPGGVSPTSSMKLGPLSRGESKMSSPSSSRGFEASAAKLKSGRVGRRPSGSQKKGRGGKGKRAPNARQGQQQQPQLREPVPGPNYVFQKACQINALMDEEVPPPMKADAALNDSDEAGRAPLALAIRHRHGHLVTLLLEMEANVNAQDAEGMSALMLAASLGEMGIVLDLLVAGADPMQKDATERSPVDWAASAPIRKRLQHCRERCTVTRFLPDIGRSVSATGESFNPSSATPSVPASPSVERKSRGSKQASGKRGGSKEAAGRRGGSKESPPRRRSSSKETPISPAGKAAAKAKAGKVERESKPGGGRTAVSVEPVRPAPVSPSGKLHASQSEVVLPTQPQLVFSRYRMEGLPRTGLPDIIERHIRGWLESIEFPPPSEVKVVVEPTTMRPQGYAYVDFLKTSKVSLLSVPPLQRHVCGRPISIVHEVQQQGHQQSAEDAELEPASESLLS